MRILFVRLFCSSRIPESFVLVSDVNRIILQTIFAWIDNFGLLIWRMFGRIFIADKRISETEAWHISPTLIGQVQNLSNKAWRILNLSNERRRIMCHASVSQKFVYRLYIVHTTVHVTYTRRKDRKSIYSRPLWINLIKDASKTELVSIVQMRSVEFTNIRWTYFIFAYVRA